MVPRFFWSLIQMPSIILGDFVVLGVNISRSRRFFRITALALLVIELVVNVGIINLVEYTEIDWVAYMDEVSGFLGGELDYQKLRGPTGPLVYPAGFVYVFSLLYYITNGGEWILVAQYLFALLDVVTLFFVFLTFYETRSFPTAGLFLLLLSKRVHSLFVLRLFNDCVAMAFMWASLWLFSRKKYALGSLVFSLALSVKMNILLFLPGLLVILWKSKGPIVSVLMLLEIFFVQIVLGLPFLVTYPGSYVSKAFEFGRVFFYEWTVNFRFLPEEIFVSHQLGMVLLGIHVALLLLFLYFKWLREASLFEFIIGKCWARNGRKREVLSEHIVTVMLTANFIGIVCARTLHYQFYVWYFHSLPYLLLQTYMPVFVRFLLLAMVEYAFLVFPSTAFSSIVLQSSHIIILLALLFAPSKPVYEEPKKKLQ